jgi:hypothetical protein
VDIVRLDLRLKGYGFLPHCFTYLHIASTGDGDDVLTLSKEPGQRGLTCRGPMLLPDRLNFFDYFEDIREILFGISRNDPANITFLEVIGAFL